jgi:methionine-rich copper-binding protein CopC
MKRALISTIFSLSLILSTTFFSGCGSTDDNRTLSGEKPQITLYGDTDVTINLGTTSIEGDNYGYEAMDPQDGDITDKVQITNDIDFTRAGTYTVTYTVTDSDGNSDTKYRYIHIVDNGDPYYYGGQTYVGSAPTIIVSDGDILYLPIGRIFTPRATASDPEDGDLTSQIQISGDSVNTYQAGEYVVTYSVIDSDGNSVYRNQTIFVGNYGNGDNGGQQYTDDNGYNNSELDTFVSWYKSECGKDFDYSLYSSSTKRYQGEIDCSHRGLYHVDLAPMGIFSSIKTINLSYNNLSEIDFSPLSNVRVIEKLDLRYNKFSHIDFSPLYHLKNINELWINGNNLNYTRAEREELYRGFNNRSFTIYFKPTF